MRTHVGWIAVVALLAATAGCAPQSEPEMTSYEQAEEIGLPGMATYTTVRLTADMSHLSDNQREMIPLLIEAAAYMDDAFWIQAYGDKQELQSSITDEAVRRYTDVNYGPWSRLNGNEPFIEGVRPKPDGANLYPADMTKDEFEAAVAESPEREAELASLYTIVRRDSEGGLEGVPYSEAFSEQVGAAAGKLREAAGLAEDAGFRGYLELRAEAMLTDDYQPSDLAWMDMKENAIDVVIGPIESYEDQLFGTKTSFEAYVLLKDLEWSERLARYAAMLPDLQAGLPVPDEYKQEPPGANADLNAYDVVYYAGDCNAGSKTIAINLPNDEEVQLQKGSRRLQLKNAMRAKFDEILVPISELLIAEDQREHVTFDAFFSNTMFHEVAHGLGIKKTLDGRGTVREALLEQTSGLEEGKADVLGLYMITALHDAGELQGPPLEDYYVTFLASTFRSVRFGASSAHGRANMMRFNFFKEMGAFSHDPETGVYRADFEKTRQAIDALSEKILRLQGDGDYDGVSAFAAEMAQVGPDLQADLDRVNAAGIPTDIVFEQGVEVLGL
jgi:hypothetical protein